MGRKAKPKKNANSREELIIKMLIENKSNREIIKKFPSFSNSQINEIKKKNVHQIDKGRAELNRRRRIEKSEQERREKEKKEREERNRNNSSRSTRSSSKHITTRSNKDAFSGSKLRGSSDKRGMRSEKQRKRDNHKNVNFSQKKKQVKRTGIIKNDNFEFNRSKTPLFVLDGIISKTPIKLASKNNRILEVGLCSGRHPMGEKKFIFTSEDGDKHMFDYDWQLSHVKKFIKENIPFEKGLATKKMMVKTTGLNSFNASVAKACAEMKVNLIFKHHDASKEIYRKQEIYSDFPMYKEDNTSLEKSIFNFVHGNMYRIETDVCWNEIFSTSPKILPNLQIVTVKVESKDKKTYEEAVVTTTYSLSWQIFENCCEMILNTPPEYKCSIYLDICVLGRNDKKETYIKERKNIAKSYSFHEYKKR